MNSHDFVIAGIHPTAIASGDIDQDGNPDLILAGDHEIVAIADRNGSPGTLVRLAEVDAPGAIDGIDFNGDSRNDIAVVGKGALSILLNKVKAFGCESHFRP